AQNESLIGARLPRQVKITSIADLDTTTRRDAPYDPAILTNKTDEVIHDPAIEVIIELIGGIEPARTFVEKALNAGKHVVTANKAMLALHGAELMDLARRKGVGLLFEASVGGGIPIIRVLEQGLCANAIQSVQGIINGTANYILTQMDEREIPFDRALAEAQAAGYAEPDPTYDIEGHDTAHKIAILASLAFGMDIRFSDVWVEGIKAIQPMDIRYARELGYAIKLLGIAKMSEDGAAEVRVHPTLLPRESQLARVNAVFNAIQVSGKPIGTTLYYWRGAGADATSSAIISDLMAIAADDGPFNVNRDSRLRIPIGSKKIRPRDELQMHYYLRFTVADRPGVIARLSQALAENAISIESMIQHKAQPGGAEGATVTIVTHLTLEKNMREFLARAAAMEINAAPPFVLRVEE
ncbi:homoserine dehydrogenase, partial [Candidatus Sumerlaeota bacterium]|nr:homoserine dehydrogenase [Candidatus Sumerlaeota bacterium]